MILQYNIQLWSRMEERAYAAQGGKCGSLHQPGFSSVILFGNTYKNESRLKNTFEGMKKGTLLDQWPRKHS